MRKNLTAVFILGFAFIISIDVFYVGPAPLSAETGREAGHPSSMAPTDKFLFPITNIDAQMADCIENCKRRNQMVAVGIEMIIEQCRRQCTVEQALALSKSTDPQVKVEAVRTLCELADRSAVPDLISLLRQDLKERTGIWAMIIPTLGSIRDERAVPILIELLNLLDDDWLGREMAARALGNIGDNSATPALIGAAWRADTRSAAIEALSKMNDERSIPVLLSAIQPEEDEEVRTAAMSGLMTFGAGAIPAIIDEFNNFSREDLQTQKRVWLCELLGKSGNEKAMNALRAARNDSDPVVRKCAEKHLVGD